MLRSLTSWRGILIWLSLAYLVLYIPLLDTVPVIVADEPWYANTAHNFASGRGLINTNVGERGGDQFFLYMVLLAGVFKIFGTSLLVGRAFSVLLGLVALWGLGYVCRRLGMGGWPLVFTCSLFLVSNVYFVLLRRLRPEALVIALSVWALYYFVKTLDTARFRTGLICGLMVGAGVMSHPNAALLAAVFAILLVGEATVRRSGLGGVLGYTLGGLIAAAIFAIWLESIRGQSLWELIREVVFETDRLSVGRQSLVLALWTNLTGFVPNYSLGLKRLYILGFEVGILCAGLAVFRRDRIAAVLSLAGLLWFALGLMLLTPFLRWSFSLVLLFSLVVAGRLLSSGVATMAPRTVKALWVCALIYAVNNLAGDAYFVVRNAGNTPHGEVVERLRADVPPGFGVLTNLELWFAFQTYPVHTSFTRWSMTPYGDIEAFLRSGELEFVVLSSAFGRAASPTTGEEETIYDNPGARFYRFVRAHVERRGSLVTVLSTRGYGDIEVWRCCRREQRTAVGDPEAG